MSQGQRGASLAARRSPAWLLTCAPVDRSRPVHEGWHGPAGRAHHARGLGAAAGIVPWRAHHAAALRVHAIAGSADYGCERVRCKHGCVAGWVLKTRRRGLVSGLRPCDSRSGLVCQMKTACVAVPLDVRLPVCACTCACTHTHTHTCTRTRTRTHTHTRTHTQTNDTHIYTHKPSPSLAYALTNTQHISLPPAPHLQHRVHPR